MSKLLEEIKEIKENMAIRSVGITDEYDGLLQNIN